MAPLDAPLPFPALPPPPPPPGGAPRRRRAGVPLTPPRPLTRALLAAAASLALLASAAAYGWEAGAGTLNASDCLDREPFCVGRVLELGYVRVVGQRPGEVDVLESGQRLTLVGLPSSWTYRTGVDEVSALATWEGGGVLRVRSAVHHPHRWVKKWVSALAVVGWFGWLLLRRRG